MQMHLFSKEIRQGILAMMEGIRVKRRDKRWKTRLTIWMRHCIKWQMKKANGITMSELAEHMKISEDEILDIIKLAVEEDVR